MEKSTNYDSVFFKSHTINEAISAFKNIAKNKTAELSYSKLSVTIDSSTWEHDNLHEFLADYGQKQKQSCLSAYIGTEYNLRIAANLTFYGLTYSTISVQAPTRAEIESVFHIFQEALPEATLPKPPPPPPPPPLKPVIFIGHGGSSQWKKLKDHLHDLHQYEVEAYEVGARAGHAIRDTLQGMLEVSNFAILVMTGEDEGKGGQLRARQNVIHELGLFQGKLGFSKAIALLEKGTEEFSNINGVRQIRFRKNEIKGTFGDVLATIKREFD